MDIIIGMSLVGIHLDNLSDMMNARYDQINHFQLFVDPAVDYLEKYSEELQYIQRNRIMIVVHSSYTVNISKKWNTDDWWMELVLREIEQAHIIGAYCLVIHPGKSMDLDRSVAINNMYSFLLHINRSTVERFGDVKLLIETPSGQGTELLYDLDDYLKFMKKLLNISDRFGCCVDSCHLFASGIDLRKKENIDHMFSKLNQTIGIGAIKLFHLNDSKAGLGEKKDRHQTIGRGMIGLDGLTIIAIFLKNIGIPIILETPRHNILDDLQLIRSLG